MAMKKLARNNANGDEVRFKFEEAGDTIEGYYLGSETWENNGDELTKHRFKTADGTIVSCLGSYVLNQDLGGIEVNTKVRVVFEGKVKTKSGRTCNAYSIEFDSEDILTA